MSNVVSREPCPKCSTDGDGKKRFISWDNGSSHCFSCNYSTGSVKKSDFKKEEKRIEPEIRKLLENPKYFSKDYRGIPPKFYREIGLGYNIIHGSKKFIYPYGKKGYKLRGAGKSFYSEGDIYNGEMFLEHLHDKATPYTLVVTEGEHDAIAAYYALGLEKYRVTSLPSGSTSVKKFFELYAEKLTSVKRIILAFDNDDPGKKAVKEFLKLCDVENVCVAQYSEHDCNKMVEMDKCEELVKAITHAKTKVPENISQMTPDELADFLHNEPPPSWPIRDFPILDRISRGIRLKELTIWAGATDSGKSTVAVQVYGNIIDEFKVPCFYVDLETPLDRSYFRLVAFWSTKRYKENQHLGDANPYIPLTFENLVCNPQCVSKEYYKEFQKDFGKYIIPYDSDGGSLLTLDKLLKLMQYSDKIRKAKIIIIDNITATTSALAGEGGDRVLIDNLMEKLAQFAKANPVHVAGIAHLSKPKEGDGFQEGRKIRISDLRGSTNIGNRATNTIYIEGDMDDGSTERKIVLGKTKIGRLRNVYCDTYIREDENEGGMLVVK